MARFIERIATRLSHIDKNVAIRIQELLDLLNAIQNAYTSTMQVQQKWQQLESDALIMYIPGNFSWRI